MTMADDYEDLHRLVDRLGPEQLREVRAHALRLVTTDDRPLSWTALDRTAAALPDVDYARFRADVDAVVDQDFLLGDDR